MSNPYRNALAELYAASQLYTGLNPAAADVCPAELVRRLMEAMAASAALLAQPELPELTDQEIAEPLALADRIVPLEREPGNNSAPDRPIWAPLGWAPPHP
jgi:hypothetical protein